MKKVISLHAREVQLQQQPLPDPEFYLLKTVTGPAGQDPVMEIQRRCSPTKGFLRQGMRG